ncbi:MAG: thymidine kinase [Paludibacteraceae bacterium]|jgi:thymidine kinase|nr:thymidine kinase [Paludibacteraceae bacterium]
MQRNDCEKKNGRLELIVGSMFSGKTEELIRRLRRAEIARLKVECFKPSIDKREEEDSFVSHDRQTMSCTRVSASGEILLLAVEADVVGIDEAQFFDEGLTSVCQQLVSEGKRVVVAGLDMDFQAQPFGPVPSLCAVADEVEKLHAICVRCGSAAYVSHRLVSEKTRILLGEQREYEPLCRDCYEKYR